jgi:hypothetical protein
MNPLLRPVLLACFLSASFAAAAERPGPRPIEPRNSIQWNVEVRNWLVRYIGGTALEMPEAGAGGADRGGS